MKRFLLKKCSELNPGIFKNFFASQNLCSLNRTKSRPLYSIFEKKSSNHSDDRFWSKYWKYTLAAFALTVLSGSISCEEDSFFTQGYEKMQKEYEPAKNRLDKFVKQFAKWKEDFDKRKEQFETEIQVITSLMNISTQKEIKKLIYPNGTYVGEVDYTVQNGQKVYFRHGLGRMQFADENVKTIQGQYVNDQISGVCLRTLKNGVIEKCTYKNNQMDGIFIIQFPNGVKMETQIRPGQKKKLLILSLLNQISWLEQDQEWHEEALAKNASVLGLRYNRFAVFESNGHEIVRFERNEGEEGYQGKGKYFSYEFSQELSLTYGQGILDQYRPSIIPEGIVVYKYKNGRVQKILFENSDVKKRAFYVEGKAYRVTTDSENKYHYEEI